jgi:sugar/nucleoside kinase (ribokinase family)
VHFSLAASYFTDVRVVGPVGDDFGDAEYQVLRDRGVDTGDIERVEGGRTFFWAGEYGYDLNTRETLDTQLGVFGEFDPKLSTESRAADMLFLGNIQPDLQRAVRRQCEGAGLVGLDSMNLWIETTRESLLDAVREVDLLFLNDSEVRELMQEPNLVRAARRVMELGPRAVIAKQGEYGASLFTGDRFFSLPAYPLETVLDPTGAGDAFAGGFMGYLDARGRGAADDHDELRRAMTYGSVLASFNVEEFGTDRVRRLERAEIDERYEEFRAITAISTAPIA